MFTGDSTGKRLRDICKSNQIPKVWSSDENGGRGEEVEKWEQNSAEYYRRKESRNGDLFRNLAALYRRITRGHQSLTRAHARSHTHTHAPTSPHTHTDTTDTTHIHTQYTYVYTNTHVHTNTHTYTHSLTQSTQPWRKVRGWRKETP